FHGTNGFHTEPAYKAPCERIVDGESVQSVEHLFLCSPIHMDTSSGVLHYTRHERQSVTKFLSGWVRNIHDFIASQGLLSIGLLEIDGRRRVGYIDRLYELSLMIQDQRHLVISFYKDQRLILKSKVTREFGAHQIVALLL